MTTRSELPPPSPKNRTFHPRYLPVPGFDGAYALDLKTGDVLSYRRKKVKVLTPTLDTRAYAMVRPDGTRTNITRQKVITGCLRERWGRGF